MVSTRSLSWTCVLVQLVLSCACLLASLAVIAAILQSTSVYPERQSPGAEWWLMSALSLLMIGTSILAMFGLAGHNVSLMVPHIVLLCVCAIFVGWCLHFVFSAVDFSDFNWWISLGALSSTEFFIISSVVLQAKVALSISEDKRIVMPQIRDDAPEHSPFGILGAEMLYLVVGVTGIGMLHGWTEGVVYQLKEYYTPLWTCASLMVLILLLIISLFFVLVFLYCNHPAVITHHCVALFASWPIALCLLVGGVISGGPYLTAIVLLAYFTGLLGFAYVYSQSVWTSSYNGPIA